MLVANASSEATTTFFIATLLKGSGELWVFSENAVAKQLSSIKQRPNPAGTVLPSYNPLSPRLGTSRRTECLVNVRNPAAYASLSP